MRLRAIIIDDEDTGITTLKLLIEKHIPEVKVVAECNRSTEAIEVIENYKPEIVFLDISMPEMDGFEVLEKLEWRNFHLIFTTAHQEYALKALKEQAFDYLLKPVYHKELRLAIDRIKDHSVQQQSASQNFDYSFLNEMNQGKLNKLGVASKDGVEFVDPSEIISLQSQGNYTLICFENGKEMISPKRLGEFESQLCNDTTNFMRVHHSYIINLQKVSRYLKEEEDIIMVNKQKIPLAKSRRENFFKWLT
jgi:two-component system, LytTR family, response regulator